MCKEVNIFSEDMYTDKNAIIVENKPIEEPARVIFSENGEEVKLKGKQFADEISAGFISDFEKTQKLLEQGKADQKDLMAHVSTFAVVNGIIYMTYYANTKEATEDPDNQTARFVYCPVNDIENKTFVDIQSVGDLCYGKKVSKVYDTILMQKDEDTLYILWTAEVGDNYYRLWRSFTISSQTLGTVQVNRFKVGNVINDFSTTGMQRALAANEIGYKTMYSDIGIMQKLSTRMEKDGLYYYSGAYSGDFTCIIKSKDLVTWEYVAEPDFPNQSKWENATYVIGDKCYYFVRQHDETQYGFLTSYDLINNTWEKPVLIGDCQSRSDFIVYKDNLYLFHAPIDREHIGIVQIDTDNISKSKVILQAHMHTSCFYPFIQYFENDGLAMSYTVERKHIRLAKFDLSKYID